MIKPVSAGKISQGRSWVKAKNSRSQWARYSGHFWSARKSSSDDLISTIQISPRSFSATRSARRPEGSDSSLTQAKPSERSSRAVPRATASAVSDWRRSGGGTRARCAAFDSIVVTLAQSRFRNKQETTDLGNRGRGNRLILADQGAGRDDRRSLVQERDFLLPVGRQLYGLQRRWRRRLQGSVAAAGLSARAWRHRDLVDAVSAHPVPGRRLRHFRLLRRRP